MSKLSASFDRNNKWKRENLCNSQRTQTAAAAAASCFQLKKSCSDLLPSLSSLLQYRCGHTNMHTSCWVTSFEFTWTFNLYMWMWNSSEFGWCFQKVRGAHISSCWYMWVTSCEPYHLLLSVRTHTAQLRCHSYVFLLYDEIWWQPRDPCQVHMSQLKHPQL